MLKGRKFFDVTNLGIELVWYTFKLIYFVLCIFWFCNHLHISCVVSIYDDDVCVSLFISRVASFLTLYTCFSFVRTYVIHLLGIYVTILFNWLILWQNTLYLYLGRSKMRLILQETLFQDQVLKLCKSVQDSNWKVPVIKAR